MGLQLREALRRLCNEIGWSYAVFWRAIRRRNQMHLIWEDGHCGRAPGTPGISGFEAMDLLLKERATLRSSRDDPVAELGCQAEDRVGSLVYKMMAIMASQVHVVGDGIVGQAASIGNHRWILHDSLNGYGSVPKGLAEMNHQFSAGIQTIAIIPVLPHGVVQLGSTQMVMENIGFINHVRSLFTQLGCVPGALVSDVTQKPLVQNIHVHASLGIPSSLNQFGDSATTTKRISPQSGDGCTHQHLKAPGTRSVVQPPSSFTQLYGKVPANASEAPLTIQTIASTKVPLSDFSQPTICPVVEHIHHQHSQLESGLMGAQEIFSNPDVRSIENTMPQDSSSGSQHQSQILTSGLSSNSLMLLEEQLLSISGSRESDNKHGLKLDNSRTLQLRSHGCAFSSSPKDSNTVPLFDRNEFPSNLNDLGRCSLFPGGTTGSFRSLCPSSSSMVVRQMLDLTDHSNSSQMLSGDPQPRRLTSIQKSQTVRTEGQQKKENNSFQASDVASTELDEQHPSYGSLLATPQDCWLSSSNPVEENKKSKDAVSIEINNCAAPSRLSIKDTDMNDSLQALNKKTNLSPVRPASGNDLFDLLGIDNKSGSFHGGLDDVFLQGNNTNAHELSADASTCITQSDTGPVYDALNAQNDEICCSGLFSEASPDELLDAVVAQINTGSKQNFDDNVSCKTSLTRMSSSSLHTSSPTYGWTASTEHVRGESLGHSPVLLKSEAAGSSSLISACSLEKTVGCSQKDGGYKSQISLWVQNGQNINCDNISASHCKRIDEVGKLNRKRPRPGENPRPRPKDRQMIQDRVKELREIVPNGAKCSIDALLEKTIKHMLFLQSVTKHADKLKEVGEPKIMSKEGGLLLKDNFEGGATWAFEVGSQSIICPIIVEDLNPPRQMLVEMLCEERGLFLEIADLIRGLGLTILKGVMEARNDKVWARFAVEVLPSVANRDVTRMEIFLSLVRLLEPNAGTSMAPQGVENLSMPHNLFHPSSIPATGLSDRLR